MLAWGNRPHPFKASIEKLVSHRRNGWNGQREASQGRRACIETQKDELFDPMVLLPHSEINAAVYEAVEQFAERQDAGADLLITIFSDGTGPLIQEKLRESFFEHYEDENRKLDRHIRGYLVKILILVLISGPAIFAWEHIRDDLLGILFETLWGFSLWEVGYTFTDNLNEWRAWRRIRRIRKASIQFMDYRNQGEHDL